VEEFLSLVEPALRQFSGSVLYSGRVAFESPSNLYVLGLNPGGCAIRQAAETIGRNIKLALERPARWSEYADESWNGRPPGTYKMQPRILHLLGRLGLDARAVPASNAIFMRSSRLKDLAFETQDSLKACWPVHRAVISKLRVKTILCMGATTGEWVRTTLGADSQIGTWHESNVRRWAGSAYRNSLGQQVLTLPHPGIAAWNAPASDPTDFVKRFL
jgi:hypothetical protein